MVNSKKIHIRTVTLERLLLSADLAKSCVLFCTGCGQASEMLSMDQASTRTEISMRDLFRLCEDGVVHSAETNSGQIMLCRRSLDEFLRKQPLEQKQSLPAENIL